jgi:hypothetical protein
MPRVNPLQAFARKPFADRLVANSLPGSEQGILGSLWSATLTLHSHPPAAWRCWNEEGKLAGCAHQIGSDLWGLGLPRSLR